MAEEDGSQVPNLDPQVYFGISPEVVGCGVFLNDHTYSHISGRLFVTEDLKTRHQTFHHIPRKGNQTINAIAFDNKRTLMAVAEQGKPPILSVYRLNSFEKIFTIFPPPNSQADCFTTMFIHCDSDRVSALLGPPENLVYTCYLDSQGGSLESVTKAMHKNIDTQVTQIIGNLEDTFHYAILGIGIFRFMMWMGDIWEDVFRSFNSAEGIAISCGTYTSHDTILVGTMDGKFILIAHEGIKAIYNPLTVERIYIELKKKGVRPLPCISPPIRDVAKNGYLRHNEIRYLQYFGRGFVYSVKEELKETIHIMLKGRFGNEPPYWIKDLTYKPPPEDDSFRTHGFIKIHVGQIADYDTLLPKNRPLYRIVNLAINKAGKCIVITFAGKFLMILDVKNDFDPPKRLPVARMMSFGFNKSPVEHVTSCVWKNVFVTAGEKVVKLYDYDKKQVFLVYTFQDHIHSISLHPTGYFGLIGFTDRAVLFGLQQLTFLPIVELDIECCRSSTFSKGGNLMVLAEETKIRAYTVYSFKEISEIIDCQAGKIIGMRLCPKNNHIWTARNNGLIAQTDISNGVKKYIFQSSPRASFDEYDNFRLIYMTGYDGSLQEIDTSQDLITQEKQLSYGKLAGVIVSKSWNLIFLGTETGHILAFKCPWDKEDTPLIENRMHYAPVTKIALSADENYLFSSAKDGSVCIWKLTDPLKPNRWDGVYRKNDGYPVPADYGRFVDPRPLKELVSYEKNYFSRQEKLMTYSPGNGLLKGLESLVTCLKSQELYGVLHPPTKYRRLEHHDYWSNLNNIGRDYILEEQHFFEQFKINHYHRTQHYIDVYKYFEEKAEDMRNKYLDRMTQIYEKLREYNVYLTGAIFHHVEGDVTTHIRKQKWFCKYFKKKAQKLLKDIVWKGRHMANMKSSKQNISRELKERKLRYNARMAMRSVLHKKIHDLLILFKGLSDIRGMYGERVDLAFDSDNESVSLSHSHSELSRPTEPMSLLHSSDPSNSINLDHTLMRFHTPPDTASAVPSQVSESDKVVRPTRVLWPEPGVGPQYTRALKTILRKRKRSYETTFGELKKSLGEKLVTLIFLELFGCCRDIRREWQDCLKDLFRGKQQELPKTSVVVKNGKDSKAQDQTEETSIQESQNSFSDTIRAKSFTIYKKKTNTNIKKKTIKKEKVDEQIVNLKVKGDSTVPKNVDKFIAHWKSEDPDMICLKAPTVRTNCLPVISSHTYNVRGKKAVSRSNKELTKKELKKSNSVTSSVFELMYNVYFHSSTIVKKHSIFKLIKQRFNGRQFKKLLLKYSPDSKLNTLAIKHILENEYLLNDNKIVQNHSIKQQRATMRDLIEYDPFSDYSSNGSMNKMKVSSSDSFYSWSDSKKSVLSSKPVMQEAKSNGSSSTESSVKPVLSSSPSEGLPALSETEKSIPFRKHSTFTDNEGIKKPYEYRMDKLRNLAFPPGNIPIGLSRIDPAEKYKSKFINIIKREQELPQAGVKILEELIEVESHADSSRYSQLSDKEIEILKKINVIKNTGALPLTSNYMVTETEETGRRFKLNSGTCSVSSSLFCTHDPLQITDLLKNDKMETQVVRTGKLDERSAARLAYDIYPEEKWYSFEPPISKGLMSVLVENDFLRDLEVSSHESSSSSSFERSIVEADASESFVTMSRYLPSNTASLFSMRDKSSVTLMGSSNDYILSKRKESGDQKSYVDLLLDDPSKVTIFDEGHFQEEKYEKSSDKETDSSDKQHAAEMEEPTVKQIDIRHKKKEHKQVKLVVDEEMQEEQEDEVIQTESEEEVFEEEVFIEKETNEIMKTNFVNFLKACDTYLANEKLFPFLKTKSHYKLEFELGDKTKEEEKVESEESAEEELPQILETEIDEEEGEEAQLDSEESSNKLEKDGPTRRTSQQIDKKELFRVTKNNRNYIEPQATYPTHSKFTTDGVLKKSERKSFQVINKVQTWLDNLPRSSKSINSEPESQQPGQLMKDGHPEGKGHHKGKKKPKERLVRMELVEEKGEIGRPRKPYEDKSIDEGEAVGKDNEYEGEDAKRGREMKLWERLNKITFPEKVKGEDILVSSYNMQLWNKLFRVNHPQTVDSFMHLEENIRRRKHAKKMKHKVDKVDIPFINKSIKVKTSNVQLSQKKIMPCPARNEEPDKLEHHDYVELSTDSDMSYNKIMKRILPKEKHPEAPSDDLESIEAPSFVLYEEIAEKKNKYTLYMRQKIKVKTNLKPNVWFVPEGHRQGEFTKGKFYYPGEIWTKGRLSDSLHIPTLGDLPQRKPKRETIKKPNLIKRPLFESKKKNISKNIKMCTKHTNGLRLVDGNVEKVRFVKIGMHFGPFYLLPIKYKRFWNTLSKLIGKDVSKTLRRIVLCRPECQTWKSLLPRKKVKIQRKSSFSIPESLIDMEQETEYWNEEEKEITETKEVGDIAKDGPNSIMHKGKPVGKVKVSVTQKRSKKVRKIKKQEMPQKLSVNTTIGVHGGDKNRKKKTDYYCEEKVKQLINSIICKALTGSKRPTLRQKGWKNGFDKKIEQHLISLIVEKVGNSTKEVINQKQYLGLERKVGRWLMSTLRWLEKSVKRLGIRRFIELVMKQAKTPMEQKKGMSYSIIHPFLKMKWPQSIMRVQKVTAKPVNIGKRKYGDIVDKFREPKKDLLSSNLGRVIFHRQRRMTSVVGLCSQLHDYVGSENKTKMSALPHRFKLQALDRNYHNLRRLRENFMAKKLRLLHGFCEYTSKKRRSFHEKNRNNPMLREKQDELRENSEKLREFHMKYCVYRGEMLLWIENIRKAKMQLNVSLERANKSWNRIKEVRNDIMDIIKLFYFDGDPNNIRKVAKDFTMKYLKNKDLREIKQQCESHSLFEKYVENNVKSEETGPKKNLASRCGKTYSKKKIMCPDLETVHRKSITLPDPCEKLETMWNAFKEKNQKASFTQGSKAQICKFQREFISEMEKILEKQRTAIRELGKNHSK